jgi:hypothetical protein
MVCGKPDAAPVVSRNSSVASRDGSMASRTFVGVPAGMTVFVGGEVQRRLREDGVRSLLIFVEVDEKVGLERGHCLKLRRLREIRPGCTVSLNDSF